MAGLTIPTDNKIFLYPNAWIVNVTAHKNELRDQHKMAEITWLHNGDIEATEEIITYNVTGVITVYD
jgi:hypothetical protein